MIKSELIHLIDQLDSSEMTDILQEMTRHVEVLNLMNQITYRVEQENVLKRKSNSQKKKTPKSLYKEERAKDNSWYRGQLKRYLKGGQVGSFNDIYVPEKVIRQLDIDEGDWIQANTINGSKRFDYMCLEKKFRLPLEEGKRIESSCLPVIRHPDFMDRYYIKLVENGGQTTHVLLSEQDVSHYKLDESSIIDYAYYKDELISGRVIWKHHSAAISLDPLEDVPKVKKITREKAQKKQIRTIRPIFKGQRIAMVGGGNSKLQLSNQKEIERREGTFIFCTGDEPPMTIKSRLKKSDVVIVYTESIGHNGMNLAKAVCKEFDIPISYTKNIGNSGFVARVSTLLKKNKGTKETRPI